MKTFLRYLAPLFFVLQFATSAFATHNRAGEIVIQQIDCSNNKVRCIIKTYSKASSINADRDTLTLCWGDGTCVQVPRANGPQPDPGVAPQGQVLPNDVKYNEYIAEHIYDGIGTYVVSMTDPNRNAGILNVNPPGSDNVQFHLQTTFTLFDGQFQGCNSSPVLNYPPLDYACVGQPFVHNPAATDPDGDSLSYEFIVPMQDVSTPVPNYTYPNNVPTAGAQGTLTLDSATGTLRWNAPQRHGEYNVAMIIISWRNGIPIDTTVRDMQILVFDCDQNHAPEIAAVDEVCVIAGDVVQFQVMATDPDAGDKIRLTAEGAPFELAISPPDNLNIWDILLATYQNQPVFKTFRWQTACEHIANLPYTVVFRAEDDFSPQNVPGVTGLASPKAMRIKVVGPPPLDVQTEPSSDHINVSWSKPYFCEDAQDEFFVGFSVWRREGSNPFLVECTPGLDGRGYIRIAANTLNEVNGRYQFTDTGVERGRTYCYRILARFAKRTNTGQPYNFVESLPSEESCVQLSRDVPLITNVSVLETTNANGRIEVRWVKPLAEDLDTLINAGPYRLQLLRAGGIVNAGFTEIASFSSPTFWQLTDAPYFDQVPELNTQGSPYTYQIAFYVNGEPEPLGFAAHASSVFLEIEPTDNRNNLSWRFEVPWVNTKYTVFRKDPLQPQWDSIAVVLQDTFYADKGLLNGREYCYYVRAEGSYGIEGIPSPLINLSQEACAVPLDNVPPCPPELSVHNICSENINCQGNEVLSNRLSWVNPMNLCEETDDVVSYNIYFAAIEGGDFNLIATIGTSGDTTFLHEPERGIAGCYAVTALDTFFNESVFSNIICVDNCPNYTLPNAFTPNGDGSNDLYTPYPYCFIESIELLVFNRWGQLVFQTKDPNINWNGENLKGKDLPSGTYFYTCKVYEQRVSGTVLAPELLRGYIDIIR